MSVISMKQLLEAGVHFGHQTRRWNPKMKPYIFTERNGIYIIDLQMTVKKIDEAYMFLRDLAAEGKTILFVGTKKQAQESIEQEAKRCEMFYVNQRWLGGMLTNFKTIQTRIARLKKIEAMEDNGEFDLLPKKEVIGLKAEQEKLEKMEVANAIYDRDKAQYDKNAEEYKNNLYTGQSLVRIFQKHIVYSFKAITINAVAFHSLV